MKFKKTMACIFIMSTVFSAMSAPLEFDLKSQTGNDDFIDFNEPRIVKSFDIKKFNPAQGTIQFLIKPSWHGTAGAKHYQTIMTITHKKIRYAISWGGRSRSLYFRINDGKNRLGTARGAIAEWVPGQSHLLAFNWGGGTLSFYMDGKCVSETELKDFSEGSAKSGAAKLTIGNSGKRALGVAIKSLEIYEEKLSLSVIKENYAKTVGADAKILVNRYPFIIYPSESVKAELNNFRTEKSKFKLDYKIVELSDPATPLRDSKSVEFELPANEKKLVEIFNPAKEKRPYGLYEASIELLQDGKLMYSDIKTFGVGVKPVQPSKDSNSPFAVWSCARRRNGKFYSGIFMRGRGKENQLEPLSILGHNYIRMGGFGWKGVEPERGKFSWKHTDEIVDMVKERNLGLLAVLGGAPDWASCIPKTEPPGGYMYGKKYYAPEDLDAWSNYIYQVAKRYKGKVKYWNIWNEPCYCFLTLWDKKNKRHLPAGCTEQAKLYYELVKRAYESIKKADPDAQVVADTGYPGWASKLFSINGGDIVKYVDIFCWHFYCQHDPDSERLVKMIRKLKSMIRDNGGKQTLWDTETGRTNAFRKSNRPLEKEQVMKIVRNLGRPKNDTSEYHWMSSSVDEWMHADFYVREMVVKMGEGINKIFNYVYDCNYPPTACAWPDGSPTINSIAALFLHKNVYNAQFVKRLELPDPDSFSYMFNEGEKSFLISWQRKGKASVSFLTGPGTFKIYDIFGNLIKESSSGSNGVLSTELTGSPIYIMNVSKNTKAVPATLKLTGPLCSIPGEKLKFNVKATNIFNQDINGKLSLRVPQGWSCEPASYDLSCKAKSEDNREFTVSIPDNAKTGMTTLSAVLNDTKAKFALRVKEAFYASYVKDAPKLDGSIKSWPQDSIVEIKERSQVVMGLVTEAENYVPTAMLKKDRWHGADDLSTKIYSAWDENNLYLSVNVKDNEVMNINRFKKPYNGDCFELFVDISKYSKSSDLFQIMMVPGFGDFKKPSWMIFQGASILAGGKVTSTLTDDGYIIQMAIPWKNFGTVKPEKGLALNIDFCLNDADLDYFDGKKAKVKTAWQGTAENYRTSENYGLIILK